MLNSILSLIGRNDAAGGGAYDPIAALGSKVIHSLDPESVSGGDGDPVATIPNPGTENDWSKIDGTVTLSVEGGKKAFYVQTGGRIECGSTTAALTDSCSIYAVVKAVTDPTTNCYWLRTFKFSGSNAVIVGFTDNKFTWFSEGDVMGDADTGEYKLIKVVGRSTALGEWRLGSDLDHAGKFRFFLATNVGLTSGEETDLLAFLNPKTGA